MKYDLAVIGGGPAGTAAGVYAARKKMKTVFISDGFGGQSVVSEEIQNWIGEVAISGADLARKFEKHLQAQKDLEIVMDWAEKIEKKGEEFLVTTKRGNQFETKAIFLALGSRRKRLGVEGEEKFIGRGVAYCATCDAPLFRGKDVAVVGGGNAGLESALDLVPYANKIYLLEFGDSLKGDAITQEKVKASGKVEIVLKSKVEEILGEAIVKGLKYEDLRNGEKKELSVQGVFVEIGSVPNSEMVKDLVNLNERGEIIIDHKTQMSSCLGIWAAGDVSDVLYKQNNISAGDAVKAVMNIQEWLNKKNQ
ncbi:MAG: FAD-dependent oxidoreductase [Candidatus Pacebacteria bacterium]|nr:FAD-dependent oxidoreductase [Candidatus Paceibacterota bacterium]